MDEECHVAEISRRTGSSSSERSSVSRSNARGKSPRKDGNTFKGSRRPSSSSGSKSGAPSTSHRNPRREVRSDRPARKVRVEPSIPDDIEAKMLPGKIRSELLSLSAENSEVVAKQMVMIDRLLTSHQDGDRALANQFGKAASERAGRVGVVRNYAGRAALAVGDFLEAKKHFGASFRINGDPMMKVYLAECETGLGKARKALDLLGEIKLGSLTPRDSAYAHLISAEARVVLGQPAAALVTLSAKYEELFAQLPPSDEVFVARWRDLKNALRHVDEK